MDSRHLVDPELQPLLDLLPGVPLTRDNLAEARQRTLPMPAIETSGVAYERLTIAGPPGAPGVELHVYRPEGDGDPRPGILHIHGGGYVMGSAAPLKDVHRAVAKTLDCVLVSVDYRLAPETAFPGAVEDCYAALAWAMASAGKLRLDASRLGVMGESAGGGLAAALALLARDRGEHRLAFQHLIYPMIDDRTCAAPDPHPFAGEFVWNAANNRFGWTALLGHEPAIEGVSPYAAAARAPDVAGLPATFISTGALDLFFEEDLEYARRLNRAGVPIELHVYPGAFHAFNLVPSAAVANAARRDSLEALRRALHPARLTPA